MSSNKKRRKLDTTKVRSSTTSHAHNGTTTTTSNGNDHIASKTFVMVSNVCEGHQRSIYSIQFNFVDLRYRDCFATVGSNRLTVYENLSNGDITVLSLYEDDNRDENFYACAWSMDEETKAPLLLVAGATGVLKIVNALECTLHSVLLGHGGAINDLKVHPTRHSLVISVSTDESMRLWNIKSGCCVAVFGGECGHRDGVLSADFHLSGTKVVSCGMDHTVKIWDLTRLESKIEASFKYNDVRALAEAEAAIEYAKPVSESGALPMSYYYYKSQKVPTRAFDTVFEYFPLYSTSRVHDNYVDCVKWFGDYIISKSVESKITLWKPRMDMKRDVGGFVQIKTFDFSDCGIWFIRFSTDFFQKLLCCGNKTGGVYLWDIDNDRVRGERISHARCNATIRHVACSFDAQTVMAVSDTGNVWRWDKRRANSQ